MLEKDQKNKKEIGKLLEKSDLDDKFKKEILDFMDELENGEIVKLLEKIQKRLKS